MSEKHPILAHGESYVVPIKRNSKCGPKKPPHEYDEAKSNILSNIESILERIENKSEYFLSEKIICARMEATFEADAYMPTSIISNSNQMKIVGGRRYTYVNNKGDDKSSKLYFVRTTDAGIRKFQNILINRKEKDNKTWSNQLCSLHSFDLLTPDEKVMGFDNDWTSGVVEVILHPMNDTPIEALNLFYETSKIPKSDTLVRTYEDGLTFISAKCDRNDLEKIKLLNPLRSIHPLGRIALAPLRSCSENIAPRVVKSGKKSTILIGVFDGGVNPSIPLLSGYVNDNDCVSTNIDNQYVQHGTGVCSAILHGNLSGKNSYDLLPTPLVSIESYRVLPLQNNSDFELYEAIDAIEKTVQSRPDIRLFNLSFGPNGPILDDNISRFTYVLDKLTYDVSSDKLNPLFCSAVGNNGNNLCPFNRIQAPSDMVNGLGIGAYVYDSNYEKARADYSCVGMGREGAKIKPDLLEFGGNVDAPFVVAGIKPDSLISTMGTSFATPLVVHKIGAVMAQSEDISPHLARVLLIQNAEFSNNISQIEQGYGFCTDHLDDLLMCDNNKITILYQGVIKSKMMIKLPLFLPQINNQKTMVNLSWTIAAVSNPFVNDPDAYTRSCIEDIFYPHSMKYKLTKESTESAKKSKTINESDEKDLLIEKDLLNDGYLKSLLPVSRSTKPFCSNTVLKHNEVKWDTVVKKHDRLKASSLYDPFIVLQSRGRNDYDDFDLRYFVSVSIEVENYEGNLYDEVLQKYPNLAPIRIRDMSQIMIDVK